MDLLVKHAFEIVSTTTNEAGAVASKGVGLLSNVFGTVAGILLNPGILDGTAEIEGLRQIENSRSQRQTKQQAEQEDEERDRRRKRLRPRLVAPVLAREVKSPRKI